MDGLRQHFRLEFLNRVVEIIIFDRLSDEDLKKIVEIQLRRLSLQILEGEFREGGTIRADVRDGKLVFGKPGSWSS